MSYTVALPDGRTVEFPDSVSKEKAAEILREQLGIGGSPEEGFVPAIKSGISELKSAGAALAGRTGVMDTERAKQIMVGEEAYQKRTFKPTEKGWSGDPLTKFTELLGGSIPYVAAPLIAGGAATLGGAPALAATGLGALVSGGQFTGQFLKRQVDEGRPLEETNLAAAAGAGTVAGALDLLSFKMFPAIRGIFGAAGKEISQDAAEQIAKQGITKMLGDYAKATGKAIGAESTTEVAQQFLERLQAGLKLDDEQARNEYWDSLIGGAVLGGALAPAGRFIERGRIKTQQAEEGRAEQAKQVQAQEAEKQRLEAEKVAFRQTPKYLDEIQTRYADMQKQEADLLARIKGKPAEGDLAAVADKLEARAQIKELRKSDDYTGTIEEYRSARKAIEERDQEATRKTAFAEANKVPGAQQDLFGELPAAKDSSPVGQLRTLDSQIKGLDAQLADARKTGDQAQIQAITNQQFDLQKQFQSMAPTPEGYAAMQTTVNKQIENLRTKLKDATTTDDMERLVGSIKQNKEALTELEQLKPFVAAAPKQSDVASRDVELKDLKKKLGRYQELGDDEAIGKLLPRIKELEATPSLMEGDQFRGTPTDDLFAAEIDKGAQEARATRESVEAEIERLRAIAEKNKGRSPVQQALFDKDLEDARSLLSLFKDGEQDWNKLKQDPANTEFRDDRDKLKTALEKDIKDLSKREGAEGATLPSRATFELSVKRKALDNLNRRMETADRFKDTTPLADNIIAERTDENVASLLDYYLPKLKPAQEGFDVQNDRAKMRKETQELRAKVHDDLIDLYDAAKTKDFNAIRKATSQFIFDATRLVNTNRLLANGKALEREANQGLREQLLTIADRPMEKGLEERADAVIERYSQVIADEREVSKAGRQLPIERVEGAANRIDEVTRELRLVNEKIQKAGRPTDDAKTAALAELKDRRKDLGEELIKLRAAKPTIAEANKQAKEVTPEMAEMQQQLGNIERQLKNLTVESGAGNVRAQLTKARDDLQAKIAAGTEEETTAGATGQRELTGIQPKRLAPTLREITPDELTDARTAFVAAETKVEELKKAVRNTEALQDNPQYFRELATRLRNEVKQYQLESKDFPDSVLLSRAKPDYMAREQNARYFDMLATLSEEGRADLKTIRQELAQAQRAVPKAEAALRDLERRQRMQEQQQGAVTKAPAGQTEAERLKAGEAREFRNYQGKTLVRPKKDVSWDIKKQSVAPVVKVPELTKAKNVLARAKEISRMAAQEASKARQISEGADLTRQINQLQEAMASLQTQIKDTFSEANAKDIETELASIDEVLQQRGTASQKAPSKVPKKYPSAPKDFGATVGFAETEARSEYNAAKKASDAAQTAYETARKAIDDLPSMASGLDFGRAESALVRAASATDKLLPKTQAAELKYLVARRDALTYNQLLGEDIRKMDADIRQTLADYSGKLATALDEKATLAKEAEDAKAAAATAEKALEEAQATARQETNKIQAERNAEFVERQKALDAAQVEKERLEKATSGVGYDTRRFTRDTSAPLMTAELNRLKRDLATADTNLGKARQKDNPEDIKKYQDEYNRIESNIDTIYASAPIVERDVEQPSAPQPAAVEGMRLPARKEGPVVRNLAGAKRIRQSGVIKLRADGLSQEAANAVHLFTVKARLDGATDASRAKLETAYTEATEGLTEDQVANQLAEGKRLLGQGPTIQIIAARER